MIPAWETIAAGTWEKIQNRTWRVSSPVGSFVVKFRSLAMARRIRDLSLSAKRAGVNVPESFIRVQDRQIVVVRPWIEGRTLHLLFRQEREKLMAAVPGQVAALNAWEKAVGHHDRKLANYVFDAGGNYWLIDVEH